MVKMTIIILYYSTSTDQCFLFSNTFFLYTLYVELYLHFLRVFYVTFLPLIYHNFVILLVP